MVRITQSQKNIGIILFLLAGMFVIFGIVYFFPSASNQGYAPEQPLPFSHKQHAGDNKIPCLYCHSGAERSKHASVPSLNVCMNCHRVVRVDSPHIQKLHKAVEENKPIEWVRIHELPDYVYFSHKRHVAQGVSCQTCHGEIEKMDRVFQAKAMTMGMCMECHRGQTTPEDVLKRFYPTEKHPTGPVAPTQCSTCHH